MSLDPSIAEPESINYTFKFITAGVYLLLLWAGLNQVVKLVKSGKLKIPDSLKAKSKTLSDLDKALANDKRYDISLLQRDILEDGSEIVIISVDNNDYLCTRGINRELYFQQKLEKKLKVVENSDS